LSPAGNSAALIRVDENPSPSVTTADAAAAPVIAAPEKDPTYTEVSLSHETLDDIDALRWEFTDTEGGVREHKIDVFFIDSSGRGWGVLVQAPEAVWSQVATALNDVLQTFVSN
jgi:hypothetical protein